MQGKGLMLTETDAKKLAAGSKTPPLYRLEVWGGDDFSHPIRMDLPPHKPRTSPHILAALLRRIVR
jgi:hypothetical protein